MIKSKSTLRSKIQNQKLEMKMKHEIKTDAAAPGTAASAVARGFTTVFTVVS